MEGLDRAAMACAMGEAPVDEPDSNEIARIERDLEAHERVAPASRKRVAQAEAEVKTAAEAKDKAIRAWLLEAELEPARAEMLAALDQVAEKAARLMAVNFLANHELTKFGSEPFTPYGPAGELIELLAWERRWSDGPYSIRPNWLPHNGPRPELPGFAAALKTYRQKVEEISR